MIDFVCEVFPERVAFSEQQCLLYRDKRRVNASPFPVPIAPMPNTHTLNKISKSRSLPRAPGRRVTHRTSVAAQCHTILNEMLKALEFLLLSPLPSAPDLT